MSREAKTARRADTLHPIEASALHARRERVFLVLAGLFLGTLAMMNILGVTRFLDLSFEFAGRQIPVPLAIGVLPYPITFLCTDLISELYGRARANLVVWVGFIINLWLALILWLGGVLPGMDERVVDAAGRMPLFFEIRALTLGTILASMIAYLTAQLCDVHLFHFWKSLTRGRHLWLRNNASTLVSQFVDTFAVITITHFYAAALPIESGQPLWPQLWVFIVTGYVFKALAAFFDTLPFYALTHYLGRYLEIDPRLEHANAGESA